MQVIELLEGRVRKRRQQHLEKAGLGLPDQDYQRTVGRIKEAATILEDLAELKKSSLGQVENEEDERENESANRRQPRSRRA